MYIAMYFGMLYFFYSNARLHANGVQRRITVQQQDVREPQERV